MEVARRVPTSFRSGQKLLVGEALIVERVVEIFDIPLHRAESHGAFLRSVEQPRVSLREEGEYGAAR